MLAAATFLKGSPQELHAHPWSALGCIAQDCWGGVRGSKAEGAEESWQEDRLAV